MKSEYIHPRLGPVQVSQTLRARRISIAVKPSGEIRLSFPVYVSARRALGFLDSKIEWIEAARTRITAKNAGRTRYTPAQTEELRRMAKIVLPQKVAQAAERFGFRYGRVTIRASRTKWGSCTSDNNISLSLWLMTLPEHLIDYVVIHELCHTVHHDHSAEFHALADRCLEGREKALRRELRSYSTGETEK